MPSILRNLLVSSLIAIAPSIGYAANPQYRCEPNTVANDAVAIAFPDVDVGAYSDPDNHVCTFAIGGASIDGPSSSSDVPPIAEILNQARSGNSFPLSLRLLLPRSAIESGAVEISQIVEEMLNANSPELNLCITALERFSDKRPPPLSLAENGALIYMSIENDRVSLQCMVLPPGESEVIRSDVPTLLLYSRSQGRSDSLFVPDPALR